MRARLKGAPADVLHQALHALVVARLNAYRLVNVEAGMPPASHVCRSIEVYFELIKQQVKDLLLPDVRRPMPPDIRNMHEVPRVREHALGHYRVNMRMPVDEVAEGLHRAHHGGNAAAAVQLQRVNAAHGIVGDPAELAKQLSVVAKVNP